MTLTPLSYHRHRVNASLLVRLPCGRVLQLYVVPGAPGLRSVAVWRWEGRPLGVATPGSA